MSGVIEARALVKKFGSTTALAGVDLHADPGTVHAVLGPNGAGKTTLIRVLATLVRPDEGTARIGGLDVAGDAAAVRRLIGLTGQYATVDEDLTGRENLVLLGRLLDLPARRARQRADELLDLVGLTADSGRLVSTYSGGMRRRLDLAAGLVGEPQILFLDEPTTGLDPGKRDDLWRTIRALVADGRTVLLTTQYLEEADALADEITVMDHGRVVARDTPAGLKQLAGGRTAVIRLREAGLLSKAADVVGGAAAGTMEYFPGNRLAVPVDDDDAFAAIVHGLQQAKVPVAEIALRLPSLDEVFRHLTGGSDQGAPAEAPTTSDRTGVSR